MKKAITPLISTILLLVFAIGLGSLVMSWGNSGQHSLEGCDEMEFGVTTLQGKSQICLENNNINMILENNGNSQIKKVELIILNEADYTAISSDVDIEPGTFKRVSIPLNSAQNSKILKIRAIPYSYMDACISKNIEFEQIGVCNEI